MNTDFLLFDDFKTETKYGIQTLDVMVRFIKILNAKKCQSRLDSFKAWLCSQIKRGITEQENLKLMQGILNYIQSDLGTDERLEAMKYLFELDFLDEA